MAPAYLRQTETIRAEVIKAACDRDAQAEVCMTWGLLSFFPANFLSRFVLSHPKINLCTRNEYDRRMLYARGPAAKSAIALGFRRGERSGAGGCLSPRVAAGCAAFPKSIRLLENRSFAWRISRPIGWCCSIAHPMSSAVWNASARRRAARRRLCWMAGAWGQALELVAKANYVSFCLPPKTMKEEKLVTRPVRDLDLTINFNMAVLRGAALSAAESEFVDYVVRVMQREG